MDTIEQPSPGEAIRVLAFIEARFPTIGPAKNLMELARRADLRLSGVRAKVVIATFQRKSPATANEFVRACEQAGIEVHTIPERSRFDFSTISAMRKLAKSFEPDIVQTHQVKSHFLMRLSGLHRKHPWIAFHHGYTWTDVKMRIYNQLNRFSLPSAQKVVTVCAAFRPELERIGVPADRIIVQHNAVKPFFAPTAVEIQQLRTSLGITDGMEVLLSVGRLSREKGHADLISALSLLRAKHPAVKLIIVGDGPDRDSLQGLAVRLGVSDAVVFAGYQAKVGAFYAMADAMVLPSHTEGSPNVLLEAMAAGLPTVATSVGGVPEIAVSGRNALLVRHGDPAALAEMIERLLENPDRRNAIAKSGRVTASSYTPDVYCESILSVYQDCLAEVPNKRRRAELRSSAASLIRG